MTSDGSMLEDYTRDATASEKRLCEEVQQGGFAVALSGGGHRATLATLGALLALVDRRLNRKVLQIASISGGSITNAFVSQRCAFEELEPGGLDPIASELTRTVVEDGVLTPPWIAAIIAITIATGSVVTLLLVGAGLVAVVAAALGLIVGFGVLMMGGHMIEWLLDRRYFRPALASAPKPTGRARLSSLSGRRVDHVFGMTDLVLGQPVYVSSQQQGMACRWLGKWLTSSMFTHSTRIPLCQTFDAGSWSLAEIVRASAAFPGIPPRRVRIPPDPVIAEVAAAPSVAFLADGGIWNNLGTQVLREGRFLGSHARRVDGVPRPFGSTPLMPLLIINGSAPQRPSYPWIFRVPGLAIFAALFQTAQILNANTVEPRVNEMMRTLQGRVRRGARRPDEYERLDLVVDLRSPGEVRLDYGTPFEEKLIRATDRSVKEWEQSVLSAVRLAFEFRDKSPGTDWLGHILQQAEPRGSYPVPGFAEIKEWDALTRGPIWKAVVEREGGGKVDAPTTLGRLNAALARRIIARSYVNTFLVSLYLAPLGDGDLDQLESLPGRLDRMLPQSARLASAPAD